MSYEICNFDDGMGQSVLVQQEQNAIWQEEQQLYNKTEETAGGSGSVKKSNNIRTTSWRCWYSNEEENTEGSIINNNSDMAGWTTWSMTEIKKWAKRKYNNWLRKSRGPPHSRWNIQAKDKRSARHDITDGQRGSWGTSCGQVNRGTSWLITGMEATTKFSTWLVYIFLYYNGISLPGGDVL